MSPLALVLIVPVISALLLAVIPSYKTSAWLNVLASGIAFVVSLGFISAPTMETQYFLVDDLSKYLIILTTFITFSTSIFSVPYIQHEIDEGKLKLGFVRYYHAMFQAFAASMLFALSSNNMGIMWVSLEAATLTTVLMVGLYRTNEALRASWKYFILCSAGIAFALFGTTLIYLAAQPVVGTGLPAMTWTALMPKVADFNPAILNLAFVFLLVGYGTKIGLAPLHSWLPDAHGEGPTPISAMLSGLLLNVAVYALLRFKMLFEGSTVSICGPLMISLGLLSLVFASFMLYRRLYIKRMFAYSSIEHMGIITLAFGVGGPIANFAGLLHMAMHSLAKSGIFYAVGNIMQVKGTQKLTQLRGLTSSHPLLGWSLVIGVLAIVGMPPFGVFMSEFLIVTSTFAYNPWLAIPVVIGLLVGFGALILRLQGVAFGTPDAEVKDHNVKIGWMSVLPVFVHLGLVLIAGIYMPEIIVGWFHNIAKMLG